MERQPKYRDALLPDTEPWCGSFGVMTRKSRHWKVERWLQIEILIQAVSELQPPQSLSSLTLSRNFNGNVLLPIPSVTVSNRATEGNWANCSLHTEIDSFQLFCQRKGKADKKLNMYNSNKHTIDGEFITYSAKWTSLHESKKIVVQISDNLLPLSRLSNPFTQTVIINKGNTKSIFIYRITSFGSNHDP